MRIVVICEGATEAALKPGLRDFVQRRTTTTSRVGIDMRQLDGRTSRKKLNRMVTTYLTGDDVLAVIAITDVYPDFTDATVAKAELTRQAGGDHDGKFRAHAAKLEFEAWLLPHWDEIARKLGVQASSPGTNPEQVNGQKPPSRHLKDLYQRAKRKYEKVVDGPLWLTADRLEHSAKSCPQLKLFLNSLLSFAGLQPFG